MAAIITDVLRKQLLQQVLDDIQDSSSGNYYYVGIGRSEPWNDSDIAPTPKNTTQEIRNAKLSLQSIKAVLDYSFVSPRSDWSYGAIYSAYNDGVVGHPINPYYVLTNENQVYICLQQARTAEGRASPSTVQPTGTLEDPFYTADGYVWKFLFSIGALNASKFLAGNYLPTRLITETDSASPASDIEQEGIQNAAVAKQIVGFEITEGGTGYENIPTVTVVGNGAGARGTATINGGAVTKIEIHESDGEPVFGSGYDWANVVIDPAPSGETDAKARPIFGPKNGFGADPRDDLRSTAVLLNAKPNGAEDGDFIITNDFRQVMLIKNPLVPQTDSAYTDLTGRAVRKLALGSITTAFTVGNTIKGSTSLAQAIIDDKDSANLWFHQTEETGFTLFTEGEQITETNGDGDGVLKAASFDGDSIAYNEGDVTFIGGEVLYIDNRAAITRSAEQTEDIKVVIQL